MRDFCSALLTMVTTSLKEHCRYFINSVSSRHRCCNDPTTFTHTNTPDRYIHTPQTLLYKLLLWIDWRVMYSSGICLTKKLSQYAQTPIMMSTCYFVSCAVNGNYISCFKRKLHNLFAVYDSLLSLLITRLRMQAPPLCCTRHRRSQ